jgi:hypothetical protein
VEAAGRNVRVEAQRQSDGHQAVRENPVGQVRVETEAGVGLHVDVGVGEHVALHAQVVAGGYINLHVQVADVRDGDPPVQVGAGGKVGIHVSSWIWRPAGGRWSC